MAFDSTKKVAFRPFSGQNIYTLADLSANKTTDKEKQAIAELNTKVDEVSKTLNQMLDKREETEELQLAFYHEMMKSRPESLRVLAEVTELAKKSKADLQRDKEDLAKAREEKQNCLREHEELMKYLGADAERDRLGSLHNDTDDSNNRPTSKRGPQSNQPTHTWRRRCYVAVLLTGAALGSLALVASEYLKKKTSEIAAKISVLAKSIFASISLSVCALFTDA